MGLQAALLSTDSTCSEASTRSIKAPRSQSTGQSSMSSLSIYISRSRPSISPGLAHQSLQVSPINLSRSRPSISPGLSINLSRSQHQSLQVSASRPCRQGSKLSFLRSRSQCLLIEVPRSRCQALVITVSLSIHPSKSCHQVCSTRPRCQYFLYRSTSTSPAITITVLQSSSGHQRSPYQVPSKGLLLMSGCQCYSIDIHLQVSPSRSCHQGVAIKAFRLRSRSSRHRGFALKFSLFRRCLQANVTPSRSCY